MKPILFLISIMVPCSSLFSQDTNNIIAPGAHLEMLADGFSFTEGPAVDRKGNIYFTDQPNNEIWMWSTSGKLSLFMSNCGRPNGLYFNKKGQLLSCSDMDNQIWSIDTKNSNHTVLLADFNDKKFNGPNDLWVTPKNEIYFTDPLYVRPYWTRNPEKQQPGERVYLLTKEGEVRVVDDKIVKPNGIIGSPDGKLLYVADIGDSKIYRYDIAPDGSLTNRKMFAPMGSDGMTIDKEGNVYITGSGVTVFNKDGKKIAHIPIKTGWTGNVCFGGKDMKTLFITASKYLYSIRMNVEGVR